MTAAELIKKLQKLPPTTIIQLAADPEGNEVYDTSYVGELRASKRHPGTVTLWPKHN